MSGGAQITDHFDDKPALVLSQAIKADLYRYSVAPSLTRTTTPTLDEDWVLAHPSPSLVDPTQDGVAVGLGGTVLGSAYLSALSVIEDRRGWLEYRPARGDDPWVPISDGMAVDGDDGRLLDGWVGLAKRCATDRIHAHDGTAVYAAVQA